MKLKVVLTPSEDGGYTAYIPALRGCISEGDTREDALVNIREALELYLEPIDDDLETISKPKFGGPWVVGLRWGIHPPNPPSKYLKTG
jgi:predicted RNase H-like HicB family nuclease